MTRPAGRVPRTPQTGRVPLISGVAALPDGRGSRGFMKRRGRPSSRLGPGRSFGPVAADEGFGEVGDQGVGVQGAVGGAGEGGLVQVRQQQRAEQLGGRPAGVRQVEFALVRTCAARRAAKASSVGSSTSRRYAAATAGSASPSRNPSSCSRPTPPRSKPGPGVPQQGGDGPAGRAVGRGGDPQRLGGVRDGRGRRPPPARPCGRRNSASRSAPRPPPPGPAPADSAARGRPAAPRGGRPAGRPAWRRGRRSGSRRGGAPADLTPPPPVRQAGWRRASGEVSCHARNTIQPRPSPKPRPRCLTGSSGGTRC